MDELSIDEVRAVAGGIRTEEAAAGFVALAGALALGPFLVAAGVAIGGAALLEGMYIEGM